MDAEEQYKKIIKSSAASIFGLLLAFSASTIFLFCEEHFSWIIGLIFSVLSFLFIVVLLFRLKWKAKILELLTSYIIKIPVVTTSLFFGFNTLAIAIGKCISFNYAFIPLIIGLGIFIWGICNISHKKNKQEDLNGQQG